MYTKSYSQTIQHVGSLAPTLDKPTEFMRWAEHMADALEFVYTKDWDTITEDIVEAAKNAQDWVDEDEE